MFKTGKLLVTLFCVLCSLPVFAQTDSVVTADSIVITYVEHGTGPLAADKKFITTHYITKTFTNREVRNTYKFGHAQISPLANVADRQPWLNALKMLRVGDEARLTIPAHVVFKYWKAFLPTQPFTAFPLSIRVLVLAAMDSLPPEAEVVAEENIEKLPPPFDVAGKDTVALKSGLQYIVVYDNVYGDQAYNGRKVTVNYTGYFTDGTVFDASYIAGTPIVFTLTRGEVIAGWDEGVRMMKTGDKYRFIVPPALGYGNKKKGSIPANSTLIFDVELISVD